MKSNTFWKSTIAGSLGGLTASWAMNEFQSLWTKAANQLSDNQGDSPEGTGEDATVKAAKAIAQKVFHHELTDDEKNWAGPALHYGFGTLAGAIYGVLADGIPLSTAGFGTVYGSIVWLAADEIAVPAFGLSKSPLQTPIPSHVQALASHLIYGITTELIRRAMVKF